MESVETVKTPCLPVPQHNILCINGTRGSVQAWKACAGSYIRREDHDVSRRLQECFKKQRNPDIRMVRVRPWMEKTDRRTGSHIH
ncbi:hypothetical protein [Commensalibacter melissae]|uniref:hypothetical protein n=1 Tax=Commensalibacter melissae TaxID=2070537 RepID=UPI0018C23996|nr:hypothetical protein [Commensalibacter melissae]